jgi:hypothetical protein
MSKIKVTRVRVNNSGSFDTVQLCRAEILFAVDHRARRIFDGTGKNL